MMNHTLCAFLQLIESYVTAVATCDTALVMTGNANPGDVALAYIEHFIHTYGHVKGDFRLQAEDDES